jgi:hypothetical protein
MSDIKVHVLNFHGIFSHIEIVLENISVQPHLYYGINRWSAPSNVWTQGPGGVASYIGAASSKYSFNIEADPAQLVARWQKYWNETSSKASILGNNCAVAAQWFLTEFAGIPNPNLSNTSFNHLALGIVWPSFIPCPVTLPGRVMSNAKFYIEARNHPEVALRYSALFIKASMAFAAVMLFVSVAALAVASTVLTGGIAAAVIVGAVGVGLASTHGFFKAANVLSARNIAHGMKKSEDNSPFGQDRVTISERFAMA